MCGIFGYHSLKNNGKETLAIAKKLFELSESRGKEASGIALQDESIIKVLKSPEPATELLKSEIFQNEIEKHFKQNKAVSFIGHSRLVTNGYEDNYNNNQPVIKNNQVLVHNGIIVNHETIRKNFELKDKTSDLDTEIIADLVSYYQNQGKSLTEALLAVYSQIKGMATIAVFSTLHKELNILTNNGSLYYCWNQDQSALVFASERHILNILIQDLSLKDFLIEEVKNLLPNHFLRINLTSNQFQNDSFSSKIQAFELNKQEIKVIQLSYIKSNKQYKNTSLNHTAENIPIDFLKQVEQRTLRINELQRCTKCILPETFPYIHFDNKGVCNYCNNYSSKPKLGENEFVQKLNLFQSNTYTKHDCLVPFSGGRDSSFALHYLKKEMGMNPIAFSYDWGMLTDLGRRNQSRMCAELGVEHILISADIRKKRKNIQKNVAAWLKRPSLGTIPLFMAGDKQYFYYANLLMKQNNLNVSIMGENMLETTFFKSAFCGIEPKFEGANTYTLSGADKIKMMRFYAKEFILNPSYVNSSLWDTFDAFKSYYMIKHESINIFDYLNWDESTVNNAIINLYDWETDPETPTTWRIGDGTVAFYNYIYFMVAGFTENDTFRSNQIREGMINRADALVKVNAENKIRWNSIQWYFNTIRLDWKNSLATINKVKTLY